MNSSPLQSCIWVTLCSKASSLTVWEGLNAEACVWVQEQHLLASGHGCFIPGDNEQNTPELGLGGSVTDLSTAQTESCPTSAALHFKPLQTHLLSGKQTAGKPAHPDFGVLNIIFKSFLNHWLLLQLGTLYSQSSIILLLQVLDYIFTFVT